MKVGGRRVGVIKKYKIATFFSSSICSIIFLINGWINANKNIFPKNESVKGRAFFLDYAFFQMFFFSTDIQIYLNLLFQLHYYRLVFIDVRMVVAVEGRGHKKVHYSFIFLLLYK